MELCNLTYLKSITPGNNAFAIQVIELFLKEAADNINEITNSCSSNNWSELYKNAHKIKPSIEMLGFPADMKEALLNINVLSKSETNIEKLVDLVNFFTSEIHSILKDLENQLQQLKSE